MSSKGRTNNPITHRNNQQKESGKGLLDRGEGNCPYGNPHWPCSISIEISILKIPESGLAHSEGNDGSDVVMKMDMEKMILLPELKKPQKPNKTEKKVCQGHESVNGHERGHLSRKITVRVSPYSSSSNCGSFESGIAEDEVEVVHTSGIDVNGLGIHVDKFVSSLEEGFDTFGKSRVIRVILNDDFTEVAIMIPGEVRIAAN